ncbi:ROK family protein [Gloeobacter kilaueensis]|uniref:ROK family protein n=1 Tax=Gloeobacter kilaueensis TaxID=1416614 RepID=UPI00059C3090
MAEQSTFPRTLAVDIGGSGIKALVLAADGSPLTERVREATPRPAPPEAVVAIIQKLSKALGPFERVSVGFPGVVRNGRTLTAHLHPDWIGFQFDAVLAQTLGKPVRVANDADVQGLGTIAGRGVELVITLGTGLGSSLFADGRLFPNLQLAHQPFLEGKTYEQHLGNPALQVKGKKKWNQALALALTNFEALFGFDACYIGGGNALYVKLDLPPHIQISSNINGLLGGIALWRDSVDEAR